MALSKLTANRHNIKRAEALARYGINTLDLPSARPRFTGYGDGVCELCGQKHLRWLFSLHFGQLQGLVALAKVDTGIDRDGEVTINPVGSKCITDWIDALPETEEKLALLKRWEAEMRKCKEAMKAKVVEDLCAEAGFDSPEDAYEAFNRVNQFENASRHMRQAIDYYQVGQLRRNAFKVENKTLSRKTCQDWLKSLLKVLQLPDPEPEKPKEPSPEVKELLDRGMETYQEKGHRLNSYYSSTFEDIHRKVSASGDFISRAQQRFYVDIVKKMGS